MKKLVCLVMVIMMALGGSVAYGAGRICAHSGYSFDTTSVELISCPHAKENFVKIPQTIYEILDFDNTDFKDFACGAEGCSGIMSLKGLYLKLIIKDDYPALVYKGNGTALNYFYCECGKKFYSDNDGTEITSEIRNRIRYQYYACLNVSGQNYRIYERPLRKGENIGKVGFYDLVDLDLNFKDEYANHNQVLVTDKLINDESKNYIISYDTTKLTLYHMPKDGKNIIEVYGEMLLPNEKACRFDKWIEGAFNSSTFNNSRKISGYSALFLACEECSKCTSCGENNVCTQYKDKEWSTKLLCQSCSQPPVPVPEPEPEPEPKPESTPTATITINNSSNSEIEVSKIEGKATLNIKSTQAINRLILTTTDGTSLNFRQNNSGDDVDITFSGSTATVTYKAIGNFFTESNGVLTGTISVESGASNTKFTIKIIPEDQPEVLTPVIPDPTPTVILVTTDPASGETLEEDAWITIKAQSTNSQITQVVVNTVSGPENLVGYSSTDEFTVVSDGINNKEYKLRVKRFFAEQETDNGNEIKTRVQVVCENGTEEPGIDLTWKVESEKEVEAEKELEAILEEGYPKVEGEDIILKIKSDSELKVKSLKDTVGNKEISLENVTLSSDNKELKLNFNYFTKDWASVIKGEVEVEGNETSKIISFEYNLAKIEIYASPDKDTVVKDDTMVKVWITYPSKGTITGVYINKGPKDFDYHKYNLLEKTSIENTFEIAHDAKNYKEYNLNAGEYFPLEDNKREGSIYVETSDGKNETKSFSWDKVVDVPEKIEVSTDPVKETEIEGNAHITFTVSSNKIIETLVLKHEYADGTKKETNLIDSNNVSLEDGEIIFEWLNETNNKTSEKKFKIKAASYFASKHNEANNKYEYKATLVVNGESYDFTWYIKQAEYLEINENDMNVTTNPASGTTVEGNVYITFTVGSDSNKEVISSLKLKHTDENGKEQITDLMNKENSLYEDGTVCFNWTKLEFTQRVFLVRAASFFKVEDNKMKATIIVNGNEHPFEWVVGNAIDINPSSDVDETLKENAIVVFTVQSKNSESLEEVNIRYIDTNGVERDGQYDGNLLNLNSEKKASLESRGFKIVEQVDKRFVFSLPVKTFSKKDSGEFKIKVYARTSGDSKAILENTWAVTTENNNMYSIISDVPSGETTKDKAQIEVKSTKANVTSITVIGENDEVLVEKKDLDLPVGTVDVDIPEKLDVTVIGTFADGSTYSRPFSWRKVSDEVSDSQEQTKNGITVTVSKPLDEIARLGEEIEVSIECTGKMITCIVNDDEIRSARGNLVEIFFYDLEESDLENGIFKIVVEVEYEKTSTKTEAGTFEFKWNTKDVEDNPDDAEVKQTDNDGVNVTYSHTPNSKAKASSYFECTVTSIYKKVTNMRWVNTTDDSNRGDFSGRFRIGDCNLVDGKYPFRVIITFDDGSVLKKDFNLVNITPEVDEEDPSDDPENTQNKENSGNEDDKENSEGGQDEDNDKERETFEFEDGDEGDPEPVDK